MDEASSASGGNWLLLGPESELPQTCDWDLVVDFSGHIEGRHRLSLPRFLYEYHDEIAQDVAKRIEQLGKVTCDRTRKTVAELLQLNSGFSYWYVSGAYEKCIVRNPDLGIFLKCVALQKLIKNLRPQKIEIIGLTLIEQRAICNVAIQNGVQVSKPSTLKEKRGYSVSRLRALIRLMHLGFSSIRNLNCRCWPDIKHSKGTLIISYSDNIRSGLVDKFDPLYWGGLPELLEEDGRPVFWAHLFDRSSGDSVVDVCHKLKRMENIAGYPHKLFLLEQMLRPSVVAKTLFYYIWLQFRLAKAEKAIGKYEFPDGLSPWPFLKGAWVRSTRGGTAVSQLAQLVLLNQLANLVTTDIRVIYLFEGMPWERELVYHLRLACSGTIYGYQHATVKSYDLRAAVFSDTRFLPDYVLYNGPVSGKVLQSIGIGNDRLVPVEALRYMYLSEAKEKSERLIESAEVSVVILEGVVDTDRFMLQLVRAELLASKNWFFVIKPHQSGQIDPQIELAGVESSRWKVTTEGIHDVLKMRYKAVCTSINSSAVVEAQALGLPTILIWNPKEIIRTPLQLTDWRRIVTKPDAFRNALEVVSVTMPENKQRIFFMEKSMMRWRSILNLD